MKKQYIAPDIKVKNIVPGKMIAASPTSVNESQGATETGYEGGYAKPFQDFINLLEAGENN